MQTEPPADVLVAWLERFRAAHAGLLPRALALVGGCSVVDTAIRRHRVCALKPSDSFEDAITRAYVWELIEEAERDALHDARGLRNRVADSAAIPSLADTLNALDALSRAHHRIARRTTLPGKWWQTHFPSAGSPSPDAEAFTLSYDAASVTILRAAKSSPDRTLRQAALLLASGLLRRELKGIARTRLTIEDYVAFRRLNFPEQLAQAIEPKHAWMPPSEPEASAALALALAERNIVAHEEMPDAAASAASTEIFISVADSLRGVISTLPAKIDAPTNEEMDPEPPPPPRDLERLRRLPHRLKELHSSLGPSDALLDRTGAWLSGWNIPLGLLTAATSVGMRLLLLSTHPELKSDSVGGWLFMATSALGLLLVLGKVIELIIHRGESPRDPVAGFLRRLSFPPLALAILALFTYGGYNIWLGLHVLDEQLIVWAGILGLVVALILVKWAFAASAWVLSMQLEFGSLLMLRHQRAGLIPSEETITFRREFPATLAAGWMPFMAAAFLGAPEKVCLGLAALASFASFFALEYHFSWIPRMLGWNSPWLIRRVGPAIGGMILVVYGAAWYSPAVAGIVSEVGNRAAGMSPLWVIELRWWYFALFGTLILSGARMYSERIKSLQGWKSSLSRVGIIGLTLYCLLALVGIAAGSRTIALSPRHPESTEPAVHLSVPHAEFRRSDDRTDLVISVNARERNAVVLVEFPDDAVADALHVYPYRGPEVRELRGWQVHAQLQMPRQPEPENCGTVQCWRHEVVVRDVRGSESGGYLIKARRAFQLETEISPTYRFGGGR
jgi:hypothetical protein